MRSHSLIFLLPLLGRLFLGIADPCQALTPSRLHPTPTRPSMPPTMPSSATIGVSTNSIRRNNLTKLNGGGAAVMQHAPAAAALFNNMKTPASILAGSIVPLGFLAALPTSNDGKSEGPVSSFLRRVYLLITVATLGNVLLSVMWATVAVNQLTETAVAPAESVWHLIQRDFDLPWVGTNAHFVLGMFGFIWMIGTRAYLSAAASGYSCPIGLSTIGMAASALCLMVSIVNRGVAAGGGDGMRYGRTVLALLGRYVALLFRQAVSLKSFGLLELSSIALAAVSTILGVGAALRGSEDS